jgi:hypothetical protein
MSVPKISLPTWIPEAVRKLIQELEQSDLPPEQRSILKPLATDKRMQNVWGVLLSRDRTSGQFVYPALRRGDRPLSSGDVYQHSALSELFHFVFIAARDKMMVTKPEEVVRHKKELLDNANRLRMLANDLDLSRIRGMFGVADPLSEMLAERDALALRHVANWLEHLTRAPRPADDPLMIKRHRGNPVARGIQILTATKLEELFGNRLDGTAATLASVATGIRTSGRASRSALTREKSSKKAGSKRR